MNEIEKINRRYSLFPIKYPSLYKFYELMRDSAWLVNEVILDTDVTDWKKLNDSERIFLHYLLAFFAQSDAIVLDNINVNFSIDVDIPEARMFFSQQISNESIHAELYGLLIETLIENPIMKQKAFNAIAEYPCIRAKTDWALKYMKSKEIREVTGQKTIKNFDGKFSWESDQLKIGNCKFEIVDSMNLLERIVCFSCVEGIFFSAAFAGIFYFKKSGLLPGVIKSNEFIARDEGIHRDFSCELFRILRKEGKYKITDEKVIEIVKEAVEIECKFVDESLNVNLIGLNMESMKNYVMFVADLLLVELGLNKIYKVNNTLTYMNLIGMKNKQNFFEGRVSEYFRSNNSLSFEIGEDF